MHRCIGIHDPSTGGANVTLSTQQPVSSTARMIGHFVHAIQDVLGTVAATKVSVGKVHEKVDQVATHDISGIIGFSGNFAGSMVLSFRNETALALAKVFAGTDVTLNSPYLTDAVGELANMIAGVAKKHLIDTYMTAPSVIVGTGHFVARMHDVPCIVIPCEIPAGAFAVEINVKEAPAGCS